MSGGLAAADLQRFAAIGIPPDLLARARVHRVDDAEARELLATNRYGDLAGLVFPYIDPHTGRRVTARLRRDHPEIQDGKPKDKYLAPYGDVRHLFFAPGAGELLAETSVPVVIVEAEKSALAVTAAAARLNRRVLAIACGGCWGWCGRRGKVIDAGGARVDEKGPLPDFDLVTWILERWAVIVFDTNTATHRQVQAARTRLARVLAQRGAQVRIVELPIEDDINGPDDYVGCHGDQALFALLDGAGVASHETTPEGMFSDTRLAETIADEVLADRYLWCKGLGWLGWTGNHWRSVTEEHVGEAVRQYVLRRFNQAVECGRSAEYEGWYALLSAGRQRAVLSLTRGIVEQTADQFDAHADLLNTPSGVVDLLTAKIRPHDPDLLLTKITRGSYRPGATHPDWDQALSALREDAREWFQIRVGQAISGRPTPDGVIPICQGGGENGKSAVTTCGILPAFGDYAAPASPKLITEKVEHSTERADLRGQRFLIAEELTEDRALNITAIKQIADVSTIKARYVHKDNMTFATSHSLFITTNYIPVVNETDHGTWRRFALLVFPYTFRKPGEAVAASFDRRGDPALKDQLREGASGQHDAVVTWAVEGARRWYKAGFPVLPGSVARDTRVWRKQADRILAFWDEYLAANAECCILTTDLFSTFNVWMKANGHHEWSKELFHGRFQSHVETARYRVEERRTTKKEILESLSWPPGTASKPTPDRAYVYLGVRFRSVADDKADDVEPNEINKLPLLPDPNPNSLDRVPLGEFGKGSGSTGRVAFSRPLEGADDAGQL